MSEFPEKLEVYVKTDGKNLLPVLAIKDDGELFKIDLSFYPEKGQRVLEDLIEELVRRWNSHDKLQKQSDLLTLGLLQEKQKTSALLSACEKISVIKQWIMRVRNAPKSLYEDIEEVEAAIAQAKKLEK